MKRRNVLLAIPTSLFVGCTQSVDTRGTLAGQIDRPNNALALSILIGAGLGYAVARDRGGSALAGVAVGAFVGAAAVTAVRYAKLLLEQNNGSLAGSFESLGQNARVERRVFVDENIPLIKERLILANAVQRGSSSAGLGQVLDTLERLERFENGRTIPTDAYERSASVYPQCVRVLPSLSGASTVPKDAVEPGQFAKEESEQHQNVVDEGAQANRLALQILAQNGISIG